MHMYVHADEFAHGIHYVVEHNHINAHTIFTFIFTQMHIALVSLPAAYTT